MFTVDNYFPIEFDGVIPLCFLSYVVVKIHVCCQSYCQIISIFSSVSFRVKHFFPFAFVPHFQYDDSKCRLTVSKHERVCASCVFCPFWKLINCYFFKYCLPPIFSFLKNPIRSMSNFVILCSMSSNFYIFHHFSLLCILGIDSVFLRYVS